MLGRIPPLLCGIALCLGTPFSVAEELPVAAFGHMPTFEQPTISPGGGFIAAVLNSGSSPRIVVLDFGRAELRTAFELEPTATDVDWIRWLGENRLLFQVTGLIGAHDVERHFIFAIDINGSNGVEINRTYNRDQYQVLSVLPDEPNKLLLQSYNPRARISTVYKVDTFSLDFERQFRNRYNADYWVAGSNGEVSFGLTVRKHPFERPYWFRARAEQEFARIEDTNLGIEESLPPMSIVGDKATVLVDANQDVRAVWEYDIPAGEFERLIFSAGDHDVDDVIWNSDRNRIIGATYHDHFEQQHYFADADTRLANIVADALPEFHTSIVSRSRDSSRLIVAAVSSRSPRKYFWFDVQQEQAGPLYSQFPELEGQKLVDVQPFEFTSDDGLQLSGYLTLPELEAGQRPALIVFPHDGPAQRDTQSFDPYVQFFANRGYAVLQINHRGSAGFGNAFREAGDGEWGQAMQQDVYSAIDWLANQDLVDTDRSGIIGKGYGGFVALTAAYQRPDQFRCIVSIGGPVDLKGFLDAKLLPGRVNQDDWRRSLTGSLEPFESAMLKEYSPETHIAKLKSTLLLIHGARDSEVPLRQVRGFERSVSFARNARIEYLEIESANQNFGDNASRLAIFQKLDTFLEKYLD